ncbi:uncharacterized protein LOC111007362 isoform X1 [Momordica charantia]|uniref:Uncharacterized protein LOC111007362 isoform X1 n=2 Tax=Momordica charantia TaxID=3673 RepID=A0A6J1C101_MOMCH|nr:uncharacterized protein LOC111007362 isoform X1 [Momordica charantia]
MISGPLSLSLPSRLFLLSRNFSLLSFLFEVYWWCDRYCDQFAVVFWVQAVRFSFEVVFFPSHVSAINSVCCLLSAGVGGIFLESFVDFRPIAVIILKRRMATFIRAMIKAHRVLYMETPAILRRKTMPFMSGAFIGLENLQTRLTDHYQSQHGSFFSFRSSSTNKNPLPTDIDLSNEESKRRLFNRLLYRSRQRGLLELDLILGKWVEDHIKSMDADGIKALISVLDLENPDLWKWLTGQEKPPEAVKTNPVFAAVQEKVVNNLNRHAAPETRTPPGQQWVRGWDDFKSGRDSPIAGNQ